MSSSEFDPGLRYSRQMRFPPIGPAGQQKLAASKVAVIGCGALGSVIANTLARAGVGSLRLIDRDVVEISNLQRQVLYDQQDVIDGLPKAVAAANHLQLINSDVEVDPRIIDLDSRNIESVCRDCDVILDGSDNFEIRFLINDVAVKHQIPWVYGGCLGAEGQTMSIVPGKSACLNCLMLDGPPPPGTTPTCDAFGIVSPIINVIASIECLEAIKMLTGNWQAVSQKLQVFSLWDNQIRQVDLSRLRDQVDCPTCRQREFNWLSGRRESQSRVLCGRDAVQLRFADREPLDLEALSRRLQPMGRVECNEYLLRFHHQQYVLTVFPDARAIVSGTDDPAVARKLYVQFLGN